MKRYILLATIAFISLSSLIAMEPGSPKEENKRKYEQRQQKHKNLKKFNEKRNPNNNRKIQYTPPVKKK